MDVRHLDMQIDAEDEVVQGFGESVLDNACPALYSGDTLLGFLTAEGEAYLRSLDLIGP